MYDCKTTAVALELKADVKKRRLEGYGAAFNVVDLDKDVIEPGAFLETIKERFAKNLIKCCWRHGSVIGKMLELREDSKGLAYAAHISETADGNDALQLVKDQAVTHSSIGYTPVVFEMDESEETLATHGRPVRRLKRLKLFEISPVPWPMCEETTSAVAKDITAGLGANLELMKALAVEIGGQVATQMGDVLRGAIAEMLAAKQEPPTPDPTPGTDEPKQEPTTEPLDPGQLLEALKAAMPDWRSMANLLRS